MASGALIPVFFCTAGDGDGIPGFCTFDAGIPDLSGAVGATF